MASEVARAEADAIGPKRHVAAPRHTWSDTRFTPLAGAADSFDKRISGGFKISLGPVNHDRCK
jgi:hypothetical protein